MDSFQMESGHLDLSNDVKKCAQQNRSAPRNWIA